MAWTVAGNIKGVKGDTGLKGDTGATGAAGTGIAIAGTVATYSALPGGLGSGDAGKGYLVSADGLLYIWDGSSFPANHSGVAFKGDPGTAATIAVGTVSALGEGATPTVVNTGSSTAASFNFGIPAGAKGDTGTTGTAGTAATIAVGTVTPLSAGATPTIVNGGSSSAATFNFGIPAGATGGTGSAGAAATIAAGTATPLSAGATPTVSNSGTSAAATFNFGIPVGAAGTNGSNGADGANGTQWFTGTGAPGTVTGSRAGDKYLDTASGDVYTLA